MCQLSSVTQSRPTLCNCMDCSTPGFPVHHQLPELAQTHVHWVGDVTQPSHQLSSLPLLPSSFSASASFPVNQFFASGGQSIGVSASASVLPMHIFGVLAMMCFLANQFTSLNVNSFIKKLKICLLQTHGAIKIKLYNLCTSYLKTHTITWNHFFYIEDSDFIT